MHKIPPLILSATLITCPLHGATSIIGNSGFENFPTATAIHTIPRTGGTAYQFDQNDVDSWRTTEPDGLIEIWESGTDGFDAYEGNYFAEINAREPASLYQEVSLSAGLNIDYLFAHRGRLGTDTMRFTIVDLGLDNIFDGFDSNGLAQGDDVIKIDQTVSADNTVWSLHYGNDVFVSDARTYRFNYEAVDTAGGNRSNGNFVDAFVSGEGVADLLPPGQGTIILPEPSTSSLLLLGASVVLMNRRRK